MRAGACAVLTAVLAATGCGAEGLPDAGAGDASQGRDLFIEHCGSCHTLADAGTRGTIGPNLDDAFRQSRKDGLGQSTIQSVVLNQIAYPVVEPTTGEPGMPADIVTGDDADSVAAYVASVASLPVRQRPPGTDTGGGTTTGEGGGGGGTTTGEGEAADGEAIFAEAGCGGCHTLEAAGAAGNVGPNLDEAKPPKELVIERVTNGMGAMPSFKDSYSPEQIAAVADYVVANAGK